MLDEMSVLRDAVARYRTVAVAAGVGRVEDGERAADLSAEELARVFGVARIPQQVLWLHAEELPVLPGGAYVLPWSDPDELLESLGTAVGVPFPWRQQLPLFWIDHVMFTFVLAEGYEGEIWRYQIDPEDWNPMRAAPGLADLFTRWTEGFTAGLYRGPSLHVDEDRLQDPFAFPVYVSQYPDDTAIRARQRECGVDIEASDDPDRLAELADEIYAVRASLR